nr:C-C motif chemokine 5-like [Anolis sagrei ordinatus]
MNSSVMIALLLASATISTQGQVHSADPGLCCFAYYKKPVPLKNIRSFEYASHKCHIPAIIFHTIVRKRICADPQDQWAQQRIAALSANRTLP